MKLNSQNPNSSTIIILEFEIRFTEIVSFNQTLPLPPPYYKYLSRLMTLGGLLCPQKY